MASRGSRGAVIQGDECLAYPWVMKLSRSQNKDEAVTLSSNMSVRRKTPNFTNIMKVSLHFTGAGQLFSIVSLYRPSLDGKKRIPSFPNP